MVRLSVGMILLAMVVTLPVCSSNLTKSSPICEDFLQAWGAKPKELRFSECKKVVGGQSDQLIASYWVPGKNAAKVEHFLIERFKMAPLRFMCCVWENFPPPDKLSQNKDGLYKDKKGQQFYIHMASEETVVKDWNRIPRFNVSVQTYLGEI
jgi:Domian of unknown function (DUF4952)